MMDMKPCDAYTPSEPLRQTLEQQQDSTVVAIVGSQALQLF